MHLSLASSQYGLDIFPNFKGNPAVANSLFKQREHILKMEHVSGRLIQSYLKILPHRHAGRFNHKGLLFRSPSATVVAFMATTDKTHLAPLKAVAVNGKEAVLERVDYLTEEDGDMVDQGVNLSSTRKGEQVMEELPSSCIDHLVKEVRSELFSGQSESSGAISASAYDTAWVAMVPDNCNDNKPMFPGCLTWVLENQKEEGFWGEMIPAGTLELPAIDCLTSTLACVLACKVWDVGYGHVARGLEFIRSNAEKIFEEHEGELPGWFYIVFTGMLEVAASHGLHVFPLEGIAMIDKIYVERQRILQKYRKEEEMNQHGSYDPPLLSYLEVLPETCDHKNKEIILLHKDEYGSLFRSPSATAAAFIVTGDQGFLPYLRDVVGSKAHEHGVVGIHPIDGLISKMCLVDFLLSVGLSDHFEEEIGSILSIVYRDWKKKEIRGDEERRDLGLKLYRDSMAFRLLRVHGYNVSPDKICRFLHNDEMVKYMEENHDYFQSAMHSIHKASELAFLGESDLDKARVFSQQILDKANHHRTNWRDGVAIHADFWKQWNHEVGHPWITRMDHLEHRRAIEHISSNPLWIAKASFFKLSYLNNSKLLQLAKENFALRQSLFREELQEVQRWTEEKGLSTIGFGREKTSYCYFLASSNCSSPHLFEVRKTITKCGVFVTIADDFYDSEGTLEELTFLTEAIRRWNCKGLIGSGRIIFEVLDSLVAETSSKCYQRTGLHVEETMRNIWRELFETWLQEAIWSKSGHIPSHEEYLQVGMTSMGITAMILPACYLQCPPPKDYVQYEDITLLTMHVCRLLNDMRSDQREEEEGKLNMVIAYTEKNLSVISQKIETMTKQVIELALLGNNLKGVCLPRPWKDMHLRVLKVFHMLFISSNLYDSPNTLVRDIKDAIYIPLP